MEYQKDIQKLVKESAHKCFLAGVGALSFVGEKGSRFFEDLIKKGRDVEAKGKEGRQGPVYDKLMDMKERFEKCGEAIETSMDEKIKKVIQKTGLPTREEISGLTQRVEALMAQVESILRKHHPKDNSTGNVSSKDVTGS